MFTKMIVGQMTMDEFETKYIPTISPKQDLIMPEVNKYFVELTEEDKKKSINKNNYIEQQKTEGKRCSW